MFNEKKTLRSETITIRVTPEAKAKYQRISKVIKPSVMMEEFFHFIGRRVKSSFSSDKLVRDYFSDEYDDIK